MKVDLRKELLDSSVGQMDLKERANSCSSRSFKTHLNSNAAVVSVSWLAKPDADITEQLA